MPVTTAPAARAWPRWRHDEGLVTIARYVSTDALTGHDLVPAVRPSHDDARVVAELYERLRDRRIRYRRQTIAWGEDQQVRHPAWLVSEGGNCLDLTACFAAMCLKQDVAPLLAITPTHAFVVLRCGWLQGPRPRDEDGFTPAFEAEGVVEEADGVVRIDDTLGVRALVDAGVLLPVDVVAAAGQRDLDEARARGRDLLQAGVRLIDVAYAFEVLGVEPAPAPSEDWRTVREHLPGGLDDNVDLFRHQEAVLERLTTSTGVMAIVAESGVGKSEVGRRLVADAPNHSGWFLTASDPAALVDSLAAVELAHQSEDVDLLERPDREALAQAALGRLRDTHYPWVVVLDNADGNPADLRKFLPRPLPARGQLVVVTTTNGAGWRRELGDEGCLRLEPAEVDDVEDAELLELSGGRALLVGAFRRLRRAIPGVRIATVDDDTQADLRGPLRHWRTLCGLEDVGFEHLRVAVAAAHLPPDDLPVDLLATASGASRAAVDRLVDLGLLTRGALGTARLHRLFGTAVRTALDADPLVDEVVEAAVTAPDVQLLVQRSGDLELVRRLRDRLAPQRDIPMDRRRKLAMRAVAEMLEVRGDTAASTALYGALREHLDEGDAEDRPLLAECLHASARATYRSKKNDRRALEQALAEGETAFGLAGGEAGGAAAGRFLAMQGLIQKELAARHTPADRRAAALGEALALLERADALRESLGGYLAGDPRLHPERVRSRFNLAGVRLPLAQAEPQAARGHLDEADAIYDQVAEAREELFGKGAHPQIAPCHQGRGLVEYYRALLVAETAAERSHALRLGVAHVVAALEQWATIEGASDGEECEKASSYLAKLALARVVHRKQVAGGEFRPLHERVDGLATEVVEELRAERDR